MQRSAPVDGFSLACERSRAGEPVLLLHGWPGTREDHRLLVPMLGDGIEAMSAGACSASPPSASAGTSSFISCSSPSS